jgi:hypothetical protein
MLPSRVKRLALMVVAVALSQKISRLIGAAPVWSIQVWLL